MSGEAKRKQHKRLNLEGTNVIIAAGIEERSGKYRTWTRGPQTGHDNGEMLSLLGLIASSVVVATARHQKRPYQALTDEAVRIFRESLEAYVHRIVQGKDEHDSYAQDAGPSSTEH